MERARRYRLIVGMMIMGLALLLLVSVASYSGDDPPNPDFPANAHVANLVGIVGAYVAHVGVWGIGTGCYLVVLLMVILGGMLVSGRELETPWIRAAGVIVLLISWCAGATNMGWQGGVVGVLVVKFILGPMGSTGSWLIVAIGMVVGALMGADVFVLWVGRKGVELLVAQGSARAAGGAVSAGSNEVGRSDPLAEQREALQQRLEARRAEEPVAPPAQPEAEKRTPKKAPAGKTGRIPFPEEPTHILKPRGTGAGVRKRRGNQKTVSDYALPTAVLLEPLPTSKGATGEEHIEMKREVLERTLEEFRIAAQVVEIDRGPVITQFELEIAPGIKITRIAALSDDIARALKAQSVRIVAPIPGKSTVGVEVPNTHREVVRFRELFEGGVLERKRMTLPLLLGKDASGSPLVTDLTQMPHLLIAGATGSGKSVCINAIIMSFLKDGGVVHVQGDSSPYDAGGDGYEEGGGGAGVGLQEDGRALFAACERGGAEHRGVQRARRGGHPQEARCRPGRGYRGGAVSHALYHHHCG